MVGEKGKSVKLQEALEQENIFLEKEQLEKLDSFTKKLLWYNRVHNISALRSEDEVIRNIVDSLIPITFVQKPKRLLDVGTGAGFPGLILAIAWMGTFVTLTEPLQKRVSFLKLMIANLDLKNVKVFKNRVEQLQDEPYNLITSRAVTNAKMLLSLTSHLANKNTHYLFYKGSSLLRELDSLKGKLNYDIVQKEKRNYLYIKGQDDS